MATELAGVRRLADAALGRAASSDPAESAVQVFLEEHPCLLPGAHGDIGPGGHHGPVPGGVFAEPSLEGLNKDRRPDFMWITRSTSLITPICIEIERPVSTGLLLTASLPAELTQALDQLTDWKVWFSESENQSIFWKQVPRGRVRRPTAPAAVRADLRPTAGVRALVPTPRAT